MSPSINVMFKVVFLVAPQRARISVIAVLLVVRLCYVVILCIKQILFVACEQYLYIFFNLYYMDYMLFMIEKEDKKVKYK